MLYRYILILRVSLEQMYSYILELVLEFLIYRNSSSVEPQTTNFPIHLVERSKLEMANISVKIVDASILPSLCESFTIIVEY